MPSVIDASVAAKWLLRDEMSKAAESVLAAVSHEGAAVPAIFPFEIENILIVAERRGRIDEADVGQAIGLLKRLDLLVEPFPSHAIGRHVALGRRYALTAYDAAYIALASHLRTALFTGDERLAAAARDQHISTVLV